MGYKAPKVEVRYVAPLEPVFRMLDEGELLQVTSGLDELGREVPDTVPVAPPVGYSHGPSLQDTILHMLRHQSLRAAADAEGFDSPEEADDFDLPDDPLDPLTEYEAQFMPVDEIRERLTEYDRRFRKKASETKEASDGSTDTDERRVADGDDSSRRSDKVSESKSKSEQNADDGGSVHKADKRAARSDE